MNQVTEPGAPADTEMGAGRLVRPAFPALCLCVLSAVTACATAGLLPPPLTVVFVLIAAGAWVTGDRLRPAPTASTVSAVSTLSLRSVLTVALVTLPWPLALLTTDTVAQLGAGTMPAEGLAVVAGGLLCAQLLRTDGPRAAVLALALAVTCVLLAGTRSTDPLPVLAMAVCLVSALTTLSLVHRTDLRSRAAVVAQQVSGPPAGRSAGLLRVGRLVSVAALTAVVAALVVPLDGPGSGSAGGFGRGFGGGFGGGSSSSGPRTAEAYTSGLLDLGARGELPDRPVVRVPADSPILWRGTVLTTYRGGQWSAGGPRPGARSGSTASDDDRPERSDRVEDLGGFTGVLLSPGRPTGLGAGVRSFASDGAVIVVDGGGGGPPASYTVRSRAGSVDDQVLRPVPTSTGDLTDPDVAGALQLPPEVPERVRELGHSLVAPATDRRDAVRAVEEHLHATATYRLDSPVPGDGVDPVDDFLFTSHQGFCEHFASAAVVLLRSGGIPARVVTGFLADGKPDGAGGRVVRANQAHAWIEVWYPGIGWSESDPTASSVLAPPQSSAADSLHRWLDVRWHRWLVAGLLVLLAGAVVGGVALRRRRRPGPGPVQDAAGPAYQSTSALERLDVALVRAGTPRAPAETLAELRERLADDLTEHTGWALECLEHERYGRRRPTVADRRRAIDEIDALTARILARSRVEALSP